MGGSRKTPSGKKARRSTGTLEKAAQKHKGTPRKPAAKRKRPGAPLASQLREVFKNEASAELKARQERLARMARELDLQQVSPERRSRNATAGRWQLELFPHLLEPGEWPAIRKGIVQRLEAFNAFVADLYADQRILRDRVVPYANILRDRAFQRTLKNLPIRDGQYLTLGAVDLVRAVDGTWHVVENQFSTPEGLGSILQVRRMLTQVYPELFEHLDVAPVAGFASQLVEALQALSNRPNPHIVLLTAGAQSRTFYEDLFLARHMGIAAVRPADLLVRESAVYLRTVRGLERVDVIYRRLPSALVDPIAFGDSPIDGVPGLVNAVRRGEVVVANALGAGIADNRSMLRYAGRIIGYYLRENALLPTIATYDLADPDQADYALKQRAGLVFKPLHDSALASAATTAGPALKSIRAEPGAYIAQQFPPLAPVPSLEGARLSAHPVCLRAFVLNGETPLVLPGGLTHRLDGARPPVRAFDSGTLKDTWLRQESDRRKPHRLTSSTTEEMSIASRVAETFYWAGRYLERAENTARQLMTLESVRWEQLGSRARRSYWPLWQTVAEANGQHAPAARKTPPKDTLPLSRQLVIDRAEPASVTRCIDAATGNIRAVQDAVTPEILAALGALATAFTDLPPPSRISRTRLIELCELVVNEVARVNGTAERTLPHEDGWQFFRVGQFIERALNTIIIGGAGLGRALDAARSPGGEEPDLTALLRLLSSLDAYRREYRSRPYLDRVARLLIQNRSNPSSLSYCLRLVRYGLSTLALTGTDPGSDTLAPKLAAVIEYLEAIPMLRLFPAHAEALDAGLPETPASRRAHRQFKQHAGHLRDELEAIHQMIEDTYFTHQHQLQNDRQVTLGF